MSPLILSALILNSSARSSAGRASKAADLPINLVVTGFYLENFFGGGGGGSNMYGRGPLGARRFCKECTERSNKCIGGEKSFTKSFLGGGGGGGGSFLPPPPLDRTLGKRITSLQAINPINFTTATPLPCISSVTFKYLPCAILDVQFSALHQRMTLQRMMRIYRLPEVEERERIGC